MNKEENQVQQEELSAINRLWDEPPVSLQYERKALSRWWKRADMERFKPH